LDRSPREPGPYTRALRLLQHFAFGPDPDELATVLTMGEKAWLADRLGRSFDTPSERALMDFVTTRFPDDRNGYEVTLRVADHLGAHRQSRPRAIRVLGAESFLDVDRKVEAKADGTKHIRFSRLGVRAVRGPAAGICDESRDARVS